MQPLNVSQVRAAADKNPAFIDVPVPEWGGSIRLRKLRASHLFEFQNKIDQLNGKPVGRDALKKPGRGKLKPKLPKTVALEGVEKIQEFYVQLVALSAVDGGGRRIFEQQADLDRLRNAPNVLMELGAEATKLNGFDTPAGNPAKNSEKTTDADSPSGSA